ncbi:hypothetical protein CAPTEDRAFT_206177 [Capitella teleta]|uniref:Uncharacterized protein n=1 Tax=Capitella teleta TaxID=283909 RepID=R7THN5_CAPTE|nr:hypothetical protein CAPTEDRAFT_206177 [Capitella teleta]|eukprot:ELT91081.1 hypothetical protein CAPTEDRAFT_206177 [Capitella teleta]
MGSFVSPATADNTPVIIAVASILGVLLIALLVFLFVFCSRRMKRATNVRRRFIPGEDEERAIVRRAEPMARDLVEIREPMPRQNNQLLDLRDVLRAMPSPQDDDVNPRGPYLYGRPQHRIVTHEVVHHHHDPAPAPPTPPPIRAAEPEPRKDWVLVRKTQRRIEKFFRIFIVSLPQSLTVQPVHINRFRSGDEVEEEARVYGQFPTRPTVYPQAPMPNTQAWQMMFYQPNIPMAMPYQHNIGALDLAGVMGRQGPTMPGLAQAPSTYEAAQPKRAIRAFDDSAIPDNRGGSAYNWGTATARAFTGGATGLFSGGASGLSSGGTARAFVGGAGKSTMADTKGLEYETRERVATYFDEEF